MHTQMHCTLCGREAPGDAQFCPGCGGSLFDHPVPPTGRLAPNHILHNRYVITRKLAQGGQSAVYLVVDSLEANRERAVKEMSESDLSPAEREKAINSFMREAHMLYTLQHPALAKVYEVFVEDRKHYLVMEYVRGHNLEDELMHEGRPLAWDRVVRWGMALCEVFGYLHSQQPPVIYRDLKPPNVMLLPDGGIKLIDFGIARWLHPERQQDTAQLGTDGYAPPEQYGGHSETRSDLYALGATMYHLLTGRVPETAPLRLSGRPLISIRKVNPTVPETVERVIMQALSLEARDRFVAAAKMRDALEWTLRPPSSDQAARSRPTPQPDLATRAESGYSIGNVGRSAPAAVGTLLPARLQVSPLRLDAGTVEPNQHHTLMLEISNRGGGQLAGHTETNLPCLTVEPAQVDPGTTGLTVHLNTANLAPGPYICHVALRTNGGDQIIPVRFVVRSRATSAPVFP